MHIEGRGSSGLLKSTSEPEERMEVASSADYIGRSANSLVTPRPLLQPLIGSIDATPLNKRTASMPECSNVDDQDAVEKAIKQLYEQTRNGVVTMVAPNHGNIEDVEPSLNQLKATTSGQKWLLLANAMYETVIIKRDQKPVSKDRFESEVKSIAKWCLDGWNDNLTESIDSIVAPFLRRMTNPHVNNYKDIISICGKSYSPNRPDYFSGFTKDDHLDSIIFTIKTINRTLSEKIRIKVPCAIFLDMILAKKVTGNPYFLTSLGSDEFARWLEALKKSEHLLIDFDSYHSIKEGAANRLFNKCLWRHSKAQYITGEMDTFSITPLEQYQANWLEDSICGLLFTPPKSDQTLPECAYEAKSRVTSLEESEGSLMERPTKYCFSSKQYHLKSGSSLPIPEGGLNFKSHELYFGEELEFWVNGVGSDASRTFRTTLEAYKDETDKLIANSGIQGYSPSYEPGRHLTYYIGSWGVKVFLDCDAVEINLTPHTKDQTFSVPTAKGQAFSYSSYDLADLLIHPVAQKLKFTGCSGHKHLDIRNSLNGNVELLFRIAVDMENTPWLPKILNRELSVHNFPYAAKSEQKKARYENMVKGVNKKLASNDGSPLAGNFADMLKLKEFLSHVDLNGKYSACALNHLEDSCHTVDLEKAPKSTIELRQFPCPRNGRESKLINELLIMRIEYLHDCQKKRKAIVYKPVDPEYYATGKDREAIAGFVEYIREAGGDPLYFKSLIRIPIPRDCNHLFEKCSDASHACATRRVTLK